MTDSNFFFIAVLPRAIHFDQLLTVTSYRPLLTL